MLKMLKILGKRGRITIPYEIRKSVGFKYNDVLSFTESADGRTVIVKRERLCDCSKNELKEPATDEITLLELLDSLTPEQQRAALVHLSVKWAENKTEKEKKEKK